MEGRLSEIEEEYRTLRKMKHQLDIEIHEMEKDRNSGVGEEGLDGDLLYPPYIKHTEQQTDMKLDVIFDQIVHEIKH